MITACICGGLIEVMLAVAATIFVLTGLRRPVWARFPNSKRGQRT